MNRSAPEAANIQQPLSLSTAAFSPIDAHATSMHAVPAPVYPSSAQPPAASVSRRSIPRRGRASLEVQGIHYTELPPAPLSGYVVGGYVLGGVLGRGSYATVYLATPLMPLEDRPTPQQQFVAVKVLSRTALARNRELVRVGGKMMTISAWDRVRREMAIMRKVQHVNVVRCVEILEDVDDDLLFLVLEFVRAGEAMTWKDMTSYLHKVENTLHVPLSAPESDSVADETGFYESSIIARNSYLSAWNLINTSSAARNTYNLQQVCNIMRDVLHGLAYLHSISIVHRDIKVDNILLQINDDTTDWPFTAKLADLGLAHMFPEDAADDRLRKPEGTPAYHAPEATSGAPFSGKASDMWAIGCCMYAFLCGKLPFTPRLGETQLQLYDRIRTSPIDWDRFTRCDAIQYVVRRLQQAASSGERGRNQYYYCLGELACALDFIALLLTKDVYSRLTAEEALNHPWLVVYGGMRPVDFSDTLSDTIKPIIQAWRSRIFNISSQPSTVPLPIRRPSARVCAHGTSSPRSEAAPTMMDALDSLVTTAVPSTRRLQQHLDFDATNSPNPTANLCNSWPPEPDVIRDEWSLLVSVPREDDLLASLYATFGEHMSTPARRPIGDVDSQPIAASPVLVACDRGDPSINGIEVRLPVAALVPAKHPRRRHKKHSHEDTTFPPGQPLPVTPDEINAAVTTVRRASIARSPSRGLAEDVAPLGSSKVGVIISLSRLKANVRRLVTGFRRRRQQRVEAAGRLGIDISSTLEPKVMLASKLQELSSMIAHLGCKDKQPTPSAPPSPPPAAASMHADALVPPPCVYRPFMESKLMLQTPLPSAAEHRTLDSHLAEGENSAALTYPHVNASTASGGSLELSLNARESLRRRLIARVRSQR